MNAQCHIQQQVEALVKRCVVFTRYPFTAFFILAIPAVGALGRVVNVVHIPTHFAFFPFQRVGMKAVSGVNMPRQFELRGSADVVRPLSAVVNRTVYAAFFFTGLCAQFIGRCFQVYRFHNIYLAGSRPFTINRIGWQHPDCRPGALP